MADKDSEIEKDKDIDEEEIEGVEKKKGLSTAMIIIIAVILASVVSGGMVGLTMYLLGGDSAESAAVADKGDEADEEEAEADTDADADDAIEEPEAKQGPALYHRLDPKFVVSFRDQRIARFMQFSLQIMTRDKEVIKQMQEHNPAVRSSLLLLFDSQTAEVMNTREGKVQLLASVTEDINRSLEELVGISGVETTYFESFLIQ